MAPSQHIDPLLFITDTPTKSNTSIPNLDPQIISSDSILGPVERPHKFDTCLYQTMVSNGYDIGDEDYIVAEDNGLGMDDVTLPKHSQYSVKRRHIWSNVYDYFEVSFPLTSTLAPCLTLYCFSYIINLETECSWGMGGIKRKLLLHLKMFPLQASIQNILNSPDLDTDSYSMLVSSLQHLKPQQT
ncbi:hypothetical protein O181_044470 [Austropuccinia psidii MF-1]|uniref:Uncharacterized protein n=1 Tax=Austropuccinia psidii MF-1 TaxID=1389203 RepID=A0A9Q3DPI7_9BASI|nr:hypothetical protein [Austropuccinia psidii MF-1]